MKDKFDLVLERLDRLDKRIEKVQEHLFNGSGKINRNWQGIKYLGMAIGFLYTIVIIYQIIGGK